MRPCPFDKEARDFVHLVCDSESLVLHVPSGCVFAVIFDKAEAVRQGLAAYGFVGELREGDANIDELARLGHSAVIHFLDHLPICIAYRHGLLIDACGGFPRTRLA
jgi:hypothetical protein